MKRIGLRLRHMRNDNPETGLFFVKGRFFGVWTGKGAGDKSHQFSRAPAVYGLSRERRPACAVSTELADGEPREGLPAGTPAGGAVSRLPNMTLGG
jgi:hypothetical protein